MSGDEDPLPPSFTSMEFPAADGNGSVLSTHDPVSEIKELYDNIEDHVDKLRGNEPPEQLETVVDETTIPRDLRQDVLSLYALSVGVIEAFSADLLIREIVDTKHQDSNQVNRFFEEDLSASRSVKMLLYAGIIDEGLHGELQRVINKRNDYVHQHNESLSIADYDSFVADAKRCVRSTKKLAIELDGEDYRDW
ncbi:hypothetical protein [Halorubrum halophilum]|jgi:hypothetical protein|uniref:hypothetical protein n=1 Tax=Halorubrum halophilum TaxID=413816 RepID=UPI0012ABCFB1|nr:hypothetical protein [Halorubrum halophilum]